MPLRLTGSFPLARRFAPFRDGLSLLQFALAVATVALAGAISWTSLILTALLVAWAFARPLPKTPAPQTLRLWTVGIAAALAATMARAWMIGDLIDAGLDFLLLLAVQRFFNRQRTREHMQLLLLGSLLVVVGAVINTGLNFPVLFVAYLVAATMALLVNHLASEGERLGPQVALQVHREALTVQRVLWRFSIQVAILALVGAVVTFVAFPRWGVGLFLRGELARDARSGFSNQVELGQFGRIKTDATVVMRIVPQGRNWGTRPTWHLRGTSFDSYSHGSWSHSGEDPTQLVGYSFGYQAVVQPDGDVSFLPRRSTPGMRLAPIPGFSASTDALTATVTLDDLGVDALFVAATPAAIRLSPRGPIEARNRILPGTSQDVRIDKAPGPVRYDFVARIGEPSVLELQRVGSPGDSAWLAPYLVKAPDLSPEIRALAEQLTAAQPTRYGKVAALVEHLSAFAYTLEPPASKLMATGADPVEAFLLETRAGHCEYFASALAILLREVDIPSRLVNGYYGAHYNDVGDYYAVRQADAHSWVEVYFGPLGWVTVDPTPAVGRIAGDEAPWWPSISQWIDALHNRYLNWVIDYDLSKQLALFDDLGLRNRSESSTWVRWRPLLIAALTLSSIVILWRSWRKRRKPGQPPETRIYRRLLTALARRGHQPNPSDSPRQFCTRVGEVEPQARDALSAFAREYEAIRFGPTAPTNALAGLRGALRQVLANLRG